MAEYPPYILGVYLRRVRRIKEPPSVYPGLRYNQPPQKTRQKIRGEVYFLAEKRRGKCQFKIPAFSGKLFSEYIAKQLGWILIICLEQKIAKMSPLWSST